MSDAPARQPPYSEEAEAAILGSMMLDADFTTSVCVKADITAESFYFHQHRFLFEQIQALRGNGKPVDLVSVGQWLRDTGALESIGGDAFVEGLIDKTPTTQNAPYYADIVKAMERRRLFIDACRKGLEDAYGLEDFDQLVSKHTNRVHDLSAHLFRQERSNREMIDALLERWKLAQQMRRNHDRVKLPGLTTPWGRLDEILMGLQPGLHMVGAPPSTGKTALENQLVHWVDAMHGPVLRIYLDDTHESAVARAACRIAGVSLAKLDNGHATNDDLEKIASDAAPIIAESRSFLIEDVETVEQVCALARLYKAKHGIVMLTVDYAQIIDSEDEDRFTQERERLILVCKKLKRLWKELRIPILLLSQVQREAYKVGADKKGAGNARKASMADLFGGAGLEHTANSIWILKMLPEDDVEPQAIDSDGRTFKFPIALHVVKNKNGPQGMVCLWFLKNYFRFDSTMTHALGNVTYWNTWEEDVETEKQMESARLQHEHKERMGRP